MSITKSQIIYIENILRNVLRKKFENHKPEPTAMPFHTRLLGKDRLALYSFIHSLNTNFGTTIFEPVALSLAHNRFTITKSQTIAGNIISTGAQRVIQDIMDDLISANRKPDKIDEIERIREVCQEGDMKKIKPTKVDLMIGDESEIYLIDLKSAKPNMGEFKGYKRTLLEWVAVTLSQNPNIKVNTLLAIPYNPYEPEPYNRWTMAGMLDLQHELKVAGEFWDFLGGIDSYDILLSCFERVGIELRQEIDTYFSRFVNL